MATNQRVSEVLLRYVVDRASVQSVAADQKLIDNAILNTKNTALSAAEAADTLDVALANIARQDAFDQLAADTYKAGGGFDQLIDKAVALGATKSEIEGLAREMDNLANAADRAGKAGGSGGCICPAPCLRRLG